MDPKVKVRSFEPEGSLVERLRCIYASSASTDVITGTGPSEAWLDAASDLLMYTGPRVDANQTVPRGASRGSGSISVLIDPPGPGGAGPRRGGRRVDVSGTGGGWKPGRASRIDKSIGEAPCTDGPARHGL